MDGDRPHLRPAGRTPAPPDRPDHRPGNCRRLTTDLSAEVAELGPYFTFQVRDSARPPDAPWEPLDTLLAGVSLDRHYARLQTELAVAAGGPVELRVAASAGHLGLMARMVCPAVGAAVLGQRIDLRMSWWQPVSRGVLPLVVPRAAIVAGSDLAPLLDTIQVLGDRTAAFSVSRKVLLGNVASAVNGALTSIVAARPDLRGRARELATNLLNRAEFADAYTGDLDADFRRRSCCLFYQASRIGRQTVCNDCILSPSPAPPPR